MKRIVGILIFLAVSSFGLFAQFSDTTELAFIQRINSRGEVSLIEVNLPNADELSDAMIMSEGNGKIKTLYLYETAVSHYKVGQYAKALYYLLADRLFFPSSVTEGCKGLFFNSAFALNLDSASVERLWQDKPASTLKENYDKLFYAAAGVYSKELVPVLKRLVLFRASKYGSVPYKMQHWLFLADIHLKQRQLRKFYDKVSDTAVPVYLQNDVPVKFRKKIARKAIKFYVKRGAYRAACSISKHYKEMGLNPVQALGLIMKKIRCKFKF